VTKDVESCGEKTLEIYSISHIFLADYVNLWYIVWDKLRKNKREGNKMELVRILIADTGEEYRRKFIDELQKEPDLQIIGQTGDGFELMRLVREQKPDMIVMEMILSGMDGVEVLEQLATLPQEVRPQVLIVSSLINGGMADLAASKGADHYLTKPCLSATVCQRIRQLHSRSNMGKHSTRRQDLEATVTNILLEIGVPPQISGYNYVREAIILTVNDMELLRAVTKLLYPEVAKRFHTTAPRVERSIRHAIRSAWKKGDPAALQKYFGRVLASGIRKPTNSEFIAMLADRLRLEHRKIE